MGLNVDEESKMLWIWSNFLVVKWVLMDFNSDMIWIWIYLFVRRFISFQDIRIFWRDSRRGNIFEIKYQTYQTILAYYWRVRREIFWKSILTMRSKLVVWRSKAEQICYSDSKSDSDSLLDTKNPQAHQITEVKMLLKVENTAKITW